MDIEGVSAVATLLRTTPIFNLARDVLTILHLGALAFGLGTVLTTDLAMLRHLAVPISAETTTMLQRAHARISLSLALLWGTGLALLVLKTGADPTQVTPKLWAKLATVTVLTGTAMAMARVGLPHLARAEGTPLLSLPLAPKLVLATLAGLSAGGWGSALLLGAAQTVLEADGPALMALLSLTHGAAVCATLFAALASHRWRRLAARLA